MASVSASFPPERDAYGWYTLGTAIGAGNTRCTKLNAKTLSWYYGGPANDASWVQLNSGNVVYNYVAIY